MPQDLQPEPLRSPHTSQSSQPPAYQIAEPTINGAGFGQEVSLPQPPAQPPAPQEPGPIEPVDNRFTNNPNRIVIERSVNQVPNYQQMLTAEERAIALAPYDPCHAQYQGNPNPPTIRSRTEVKQRQAADLEAQRLSRQLG